jgi:hypothetical protein
VEKLGVYADNIKMAIEKKWPGEGDELIHSCALKFEGVESYCK